MPSPFPELPRDQAEQLRQLAALHPELFTDDALAALLDGAGEASRAPVAAVPLGDNAANTGPVYLQAGQCEAVTRAGQRCRARAKRGSALCPMHDPGQHAIWTRDRKPKYVVDQQLEALRRIVAAGPVRAPEFHRLARAAGVPATQVYRLAARAGLHPRKVEGLGSSGYVVWERDWPEEHGLEVRPGRPGYYAKLWIRGRLIQRKLSNDKAEALKMLRELRGDGATVKETLASDAGEEAEPPGGPAAETKVEGKGMQ